MTSLHIWFHPSFFSFWIMNSYAVLCVCVYLALEVSKTWLSYRRQIFSLSRMQTGTNTHTHLFQGSIKGHFCYLNVAREKVVKSVCEALFRPHQMTSSILNTVCVLCLCAFFPNEKNAVLEIAAIYSVFKATTTCTAHTRAHTGEDWCSKTNTCGHQWTFQIPSWTVPNAVLLSQFWGLSYHCR